jgi:hypothetical protein
MPAVEQPSASSRLPIKQLYLIKFAEEKKCMKLAAIKPSSPAK